MPSVRQYYHCYCLFAAADADADWEELSIFGQSFRDSFMVFICGWMFLAASFFLFPSFNNFEDIEIVKTIDGVVVTVGLKFAWNVR